jgi:hypothetical protein
MQKNITFKKNIGLNNTYTGDWHFMLEETERVPWDAWRSSPHQQAVAAT